MLVTLVIAYYKCNDFNLYMYMPKFIILEGNGLVYSLLIHPEPLDLTRSAWCHPERAGGGRGTWLNHKNSTAERQFAQGDHIKFLMTL